MGPWGEGEAGRKEGERVFAGIGASRGSRVSSWVSVESSPGLYPDPDLTGLRGWIGSPGPPGGGRKAAGCLRTRPQEI